MTLSLEQIISAYDPAKPLAEAATIPSAWYTDPRIYDLERKSVFAGSWQVVGRADQVAEPGCYLTAEVAGEPIVVIRGEDGVLRAFFNVCRHHAAIVATESAGQVNSLHCPYHGWTYDLCGQLKGTPEFDGVCGFNKSDNGLVPVRVDTWEHFVFVCMNSEAPGLTDFLGELVGRVSPLGLNQLTFFDRRSYEIGCNWKVFVDNYLDGGYHVPHAHKSLSTVIDYAAYTIENGERFCVQSSPLTSEGADAATLAVRQGEMAYYYWVYPNFMINWYEGVMDTNLALPLGVDKTLVIFDFYFADTSAAARERNEASIAVADLVQQEDIDLCESVQRGLGSRAYDTGRLSVRREGGEQLFHQLLHGDLSQCPENV